MKISDLRVNQGNVEVEGEISEIGDTRAFNKFGKELKVANAILKDDSGSIKLTLWNDDVTRFKEKDRIKIVNGYVNEFQGEKQLTSGKFGRMEKIGGGNISTEPINSSSIRKSSKKDEYDEKIEEMPEEEHFKSEVEEELY